MRFRANAVKRHLHNGSVAHAIWLFTADADVAEIAGGIGADAVILDREHTTSSMRDIREQLRSVRSAGESTALIRLRAGGLGEIPVLLDAGAEGLVLPDVRSPEQATAFVAATRYPPFGTRAAHHTVSRAAGGVPTQTPTSGAIRMSFC